MADRLMQRTDRTEHNTYQYLRLSMVGALLTLFFSLLIEIDQTDGCAQTSISAYYFTEVQAVFVGTLLVLGVAMVAISGRLVVEDAALNLAGLLAPIVAFVPTKELDYCGALSKAERKQEEAQLAEAFTDGSVVNNIGAYLMVVTAGLLLSGFVLWRTRAPGTYTAAWLLSAGWLVLVAYTFIWRDDVFIDRAHIVSAVSMFVCIFIVVCANAAYRPDPDDDEESEALPWWRRLWQRRSRVARIAYGLIAAAMAASVIGIAAWTWAFGFDHWFFWIEVVLLVLFAVFWLVQTAERFGDHDHDHDCDHDHDREQLSELGTDRAGADSDGAGDGAVPALQSSEE